MLTTKKKVAVTAGLVLSLATFGSKPSQAATLASSDALVIFSNFNYTSPDIPPDISNYTNVDTDTFTSGTGGKVIATADANAFAASDNAFNNTYSNIIGEDTNYLGRAESLAEIGMFNFSIAKNTLFSFDFNAILNLETSVDNPQHESANAYGNIALELINQANGEVLDYLYILGNISSSNDNDALNYKKSDNITFDPSATIFVKNFGGTQEYANAITQGTYSRTFTEDTVLSIRESKNNKVSVQVPEPMSCGGIAVAALMGLSHVLWWYRSCGSDGIMVETQTEART